MSTVAALAALLANGADKNFFTQMQLFWQRKYEANVKKMEAQEKYCAKYEDAIEKAMDPDQKIDFKNFHKDKGVEWSEEMAEKYAQAKVWQYDKDLLAKYSELDVEYDAMKTIYDTMAQLCDSMKDPLKQLVSTNAQDTHLLQS